MTRTRPIVYALVALGILAGVLSYIRVGSAIIASAMALMALAARKDEASRGIIATYLPILIAISLFAMAIALPRGL